MRRLEDIKAKMLDPALTASDSVAIERAVSLWRSAAEAENLELASKKVEIEEENLRRAAALESKRFRISVLAPLVSAAAVVIALGIQIYQVRTNATLQRESNDSTNFREAVKMIVSGNRDTSVGGAMLLASSLRSHSKEYRATARQLAVDLLGSVKLHESFNILFPAVVESTDWSNFADLLELSRNISSIYSERVRLRDELEKKKLPVGQIEREKKVADDETNQVASAIVKFLKRTDRP